MRFCNTLQDYESAKNQGTITDDLFVVILQDKLAKFKGQTFDWSQNADLTALATKGELEALAEEIASNERVWAEALNDLNERINEIGTGGGGGGGTSDIVVDAALSTTSTNAIQNKAVANALNDKQDNIADLETIRTNAQKGATALQEEQYVGTVQAVDTGDVVDDVNVAYATEAYVDDKITKLSDELIEVTEVHYSLNDNRYFNGMNAKVGNTFTAEEGTSGSGVACRKFAVKAGEQYRIVGRGNSYAYKGYWLTDNNNIVTRVIGDVESFDVVLTIEGKESTLYVNCVNYNDSTDGVWGKGSVNKIDILSEQVAVLSEEIKDFGNKEFSETSSLNDGIVSGYAYNLSGATIGNYYSNTPTKYDGYAYLRVLIDSSKTYTIKGVGSPYAFRFFAFLDKNSKVLEVSSGDYATRLSPLTLTPPTEAAILIVNFMEYNAETDGVVCTEDYSIKEIKDAKNEKWNGKTIVTFGDSISQFEDSNFMSYPKWLHHYTNANVVNVGIGGTQLRMRTTPSATPASDNQAYAGVDIYSLVKAATSQDFSIVNGSAEYIQNNLSPMDSVLEPIQRLQSIDWQKVDAVVVFGGTNDWYNGGSSIGTTGSNDEKTTMGAINKIIEMFGTTYPHIQLYWFTPIVRYIGEESAWNDANWGGNLEVSGNTLVEIVDLIKSEVERHDIPICDLYRTLGWNQYNFKYYFNSSDGTHPNRGLRFIAQKVKAFMESNMTFL